MASLIRIRRGSKTAIGDGIPSPQNARSGELMYAYNVNASPQVHELWIDTGSVNILLGRANPETIEHKHNSIPALDDIEDPETPFYPNDYGVAFALDKKLDKIETHSVLYGTDRTSLPDTTQIAYAINDDAPTVAADSDKGLIPSRSALWKVSDSKLNKNLSADNKQKILRISNAGDVAPFDGDAYYTIQNYSYTDASDPTKNGNSGIIDNYSLPGVQIFEARDAGGQAILEMSISHPIVLGHLSSVGTDAGKNARITFVKDNTGAVKAYLIKNGALPNVYADLDANNEMINYGELVTYVQSVVDSIAGGLDVPVLVDDMAQLNSQYPFSSQKDGFFAIIKDLGEGELHRSGRAWKNSQESDDWIIIADQGHSGDDVWITLSTETGHVGQLTLVSTVQEAINGAIQKSSIQTTYPTAASDNSTVVGAKLFYDSIGDLEGQSGIGSSVISIMTTLDAKNVKDTGAQSIAGQKTFSTNIFVPAASTLPSDASTYTTSPATIAQVASVDNKFGEIDGGVWQG